MFEGTFYGCAKGEDDKWFRVDIVAHLVDGTSKILDKKASYCTKQAYESALKLTSGERCRVSCSVGQYGTLVIDNIRPVSGTTATHT